MANHHWPNLFAGLNPSPWATEACNRQQFNNWEKVSWCKATKEIHNDNQSEKYSQYVLFSYLFIFFVLKFQRFLAFMGFI